MDLDALLYQNSGKFIRDTPVEGDRRYASFIHLTSYPNFYGYVLDKVTGLDFFSQFDKTNLLEGPTATRYRRAVLEPGAAKPGTEMVRDFLGRPQSVDVLAAWLGGKTSGYQQE